MGMREGLRIFFRRWRAAAPGQQQEPFLALLLALVALGILCAERLAPPAPLCALLCVCAPFGAETAPITTASAITTSVIVMATLFF